MPSRVQHVKQMLLLLASMPFLLVRCTACPLASFCPLRLLSLSFLIVAVISAIQKITKQLNAFRKTKFKAIFVTLFVIVLASICAHVLTAPGADTLSVIPQEVVVAPGEEVKITITVRFAHRQPCLYSDWKIIYYIKGNITVVSETEARVDSTRFKAIKELVVKPYSSGVIEVVYKYGSKCPFGDEERAKVEITVSEEPSGAQPQVSEEKVDVLSYIYENRALTLYVLLVVSLASFIFLASKAEKHLVKARYAVCAIVLAVFVAVPFILTGMLCPCMIGGLQEGILSLINGAYAAAEFSIFNVYIAVFIVLIVSSLAVRRFWCDWLCPIGFLQDLLARIYGKIKVPSKADKVMKLAKYGVLVALIALVVSTNSPWFCINSCFITAFTQALYYIRIKFTVLVQYL